MLWNVSTNCRNLLTWMPSCGFNFWVDQCVTLSINLKHCGQWFFGISQHFVARLNWVLQSILQLHPSIVLITAVRATYETKWQTLACSTSKSHNTAGRLHHTHFKIPQSHNFFLNRCYYLSLKEGWLHKTQKLSSSDERMPGSSTSALCKQMLQMGWREKRSLTGRQWDTCDQQNLAFVNAHTCKQRAAARHIVHQSFQGWWNVSLSAPRTLETWRQSRQNAIFSVRHGFLCAQGHTDKGYGSEKDIKIVKYGG